MIGNNKMHGLMSDHVSENKVRRKDQPPIEREVSPRRAVAPLGALVHHVNASRTISQARSDDSEVPLNLRARLLP
jgi:hypothetical protein